MVTLLVVQAGGRVNGLRNPINHHIGEELILRIRASEVTATIAPGAELLGNPGAEPNWRVIEAVSQSLGLGSLNTLIAGFLLAPAVHLFQPGLLCRGQVLTISRMGGDTNHIQMNADDILRISKAESGSNHRAPVSSLRAIASIAQDVPHQHCEPVGNTARVDSTFMRGIGEAIPRQRGN